LICEDFVESSFRIHLGIRVFNVFRAEVEPVVLGSLTHLSYWLMLYWIYRERIFLRI
jgi:hypothetical protein